MSIQVDRMSAEIFQLLDIAPVYKKIGTVRARIAKSGEKVDTILPSGVVETTNIANEGDGIVTNPGGEEYIVPKSKFGLKYVESETSGIYYPIGYIKATRNPYECDIKIETRWGDQIGDSNCLFADSCDSKGQSMENSPYLIDFISFGETYVLDNK
jgi:hypothetical protein